MIGAFRAIAVTVPLWAAGISDAAAAQKVDTARAYPGLEIVFLGTAGGPPLRLDRSEPSTLLMVDGRQYLLDCGIGTMRRMIEGGIKSEQVRTIFLTHLHADHALGLADLMANDFLQQGLTDAAGAINVYGPQQTAELVGAAFRFIAIGFRPFAAENPAGFQVVNGELASPFIAHEFNGDGVIFHDDKIEVTAVENSHYALMPIEQRKEIRSYSYGIKTPYGRLVFTGDTGPSDGLSRLAKGADVLVAEASSRDSEDLDRLVSSMAAHAHWSPERSRMFRAHFQFEHLDSDTVGQLAAKAGVKAVLLYHYDPEDKSDQASYVNEVRKRFSGRVFAPDDLDRYCMSTDIIRPCPEYAKRPSAHESSIRAP